MLLNGAPINTGPLNGSVAPLPGLSGIRQFEADFETATAHVLGTSTTRRPDAVTFDYLTAFSRGPITIGDPSEGAEARTWYVRADAGQKLWIARSNAGGTGWEAESLLHDYAYSGPSAIVELDLAFDEDGNPVVVAERPSGAADGPELWIYWWDPVWSDFIFSAHGEGRTPRCVYDLFPISPNPDVCPWEADVQVVYIKAGSGLVRLEQGEHFDTPHPSPVADDPNIYLEEIYPTLSRRLQVAYSKRHPATGTYELLTLSSRPFPESQLSRPSFSQELAFDLAWYRGELWRQPDDSITTEDYTLRVIVVEECDYLELQCADSFPVGAQPDTGGIWTVQNQTSTAPPINAGGFRTFTVSITHGSGTMTPCVFRVRAKKTVGAQTCYSPWRYWFSAIEGLPDSHNIASTLVNCGHDVIVCVPLPGLYLYQFAFDDKGCHPCETEGAICAAYCAPYGFFCGGWTPSTPFLWRQDWGVRVRSQMLISFSDSHQSYDFTLYGRVFKSWSSGAGGLFGAGSEDQSPITIPADL